MKRLMISSGYKAKCYSSVAEFLDSGQLEHTGCIIADVQMPKASGLDMQRELISAGHRIPIVFITAFPDDKGREDALKAGAHCYLRKPVSIDALLGCVRSALKQGQED
jgi:FixJ family two-component response regulator